MIPTAQQRSAIYSALILESASLATGEPERRLSSDQPLGAGVRDAPGSDASDGSGNKATGRVPPYPNGVLVDHAPGASTKLSEIPFIPQLKCRAVEFGS